MMVDINNLVSLYVEVQHDLDELKYLSELYDYVKKLPDNEQGRLKAMYALGASWSLAKKPWREYH